MKLKALIVSFMIAFAGIVNAQTATEILTKAQNQAKVENKNVFSFFSISLKIKRSFFINKKVNSSFYVILALKNAIKKVDFISNVNVFSSVNIPKINIISNVKI